MRNFLLAGNVAAIAASTAIDNAPAGALGFYYMKTVFLLLMLLAN